MAAMLAYPLLGSSRPLSVSTTSAIAMLTAVIVITVSTQMPDINAPSIAASLALLVGIFLILARILRLGFLANFISLPVLIGFKAGVGIVILIGQLKSALGVQVTSYTTIGTLLEMSGLLAATHIPTLLVTLAGIITLLALPKFFPKLSAPLVWVTLSVIASYTLGLTALGVKVVGAVPSGLPTLALPDVSLFPLLWPAALGIALMSFTESVAAARSFCQRDDTPVNANQELLAIGAANVASAILGGLPAGGGTSQTAVANAAKVNTQLAQWVGVALVLVTLLLLSDAIALLPKSALAALILVTAVSMIKPESFRAIARIRKTELIWSLATLAGVILIGTLNGILIAVAISILTLFYQANHPPVYVVGYNRKKDIFSRIGEHAGDETYSGLLMLRTEGRITFASAANIAEKMQVLIAENQPKVIVLECSAIPDIEYTALVMLTEAEENLRARGINLWLAALNPDLLKIIERTPLGVTLGHGRIFFSLRKALKAWQEQYSPGGKKPINLINQQTLKNGVIV
jgi:SulP family sulfate permease